MKKVISIILIVCIATVFLTGCSFNQISADEDIINMQIGGYIYTSQIRADSKEERDFLKIREKTISKLMGYIDDTAESAFTVTDGLRKYEDNLMDYIDKIKNPSLSYNSIITGIAEKIIAYEVILDSLEQEIRLYAKMKPENDGLASAIDTFKIDSVCKLFTVQSEYITWLKNNTASISYILEETSQRQAEKLISSSASLLEKKIYNSFLKETETYEAFSFMYSVIVSADYYATSIYLNNAAETISLAKSGKSNNLVSDEDLAMLEALYNEAEKIISPPQGLKELNQKDSSVKLFKSVMAEGENTIPSFDIVALMMNNYLNLPSYEMILETFPEPSTEEIQEELNSAGFKISQNPALLEEIVNEIPKPLTELTEDSRRATEAAAREAAIRENRISDINLAQFAISAISNLTTDGAYNMLISKISDLIANGKNQMTEAERQQAINLIKTNMNELIGDNRASFINLITNESAENLYSTFENWKNNIKNIKEHVFTKDDLRDLLNLMGVTLTDPETSQEPSDSIPPTQSPQASNPTLTPPPQNTASPVESNLPTDPAKTTDNFRITYITGLWQTIRELDPYLDNESILYTIYGWTDLLDYSKYEKKEILNKDGNISQIQYMDKNNNPVGWAIRYYDDSIEYSYHFPDDKFHNLEIRRLGSVEKSYMYQVSTEDETSGRMTAVRFNEPNHPETEENLIYIVQREGQKRDGLNTTTYNSNPTYTIFDMEEIWESYTFRNNILIREMENSHNGSNIESSIKEYYDDGKIKREFTELNGKEHGLYTSYYKNGMVETKRNYKNGEFHGVFETFFEDGHTNDFTTYADGKKDGTAYGYYPGETHYLRYESEYSDGEENGIFKSYSVKGSLNIEIEYKDGIADGIYRDYVIDDEVHTSSYHVFGQNENGKRTGIWEFGSDNINWIEQVYYEDGVKIWSQYADSKYRTYYNPDGSENRKEIKP